VAASGSLSPQSDVSGSEEDEDDEEDDDAKQEEDSGDEEQRAVHESEYEEQYTAYRHEDEEQETVFGSEEALASAHTLPTPEPGLSSQAYQELANASAAVEDVMKDLAPPRVSHEPSVKEEPMKTDKENLAPTASLGKRGLTAPQQQDQLRKKRTMDDLRIDMNY
jgi:hypothetical protein